MKIATRDIAALLSQPEPKYHAYLFYGHDVGLVRERARTIALHFTDQLDDPFAVSIFPAKTCLQIRPAYLTVLMLTCLWWLASSHVTGIGTEMTEAIKIDLSLARSGPTGDTGSRQIQGMYRLNSAINTPLVHLSAVIRMKTGL